MIASSPAVSASISTSSSVPKQTFSSEMSSFAKDVYEQKYAWKNEDGEVVEKWEDTSKRVVHTVLEALGYDENSEEVRDLTKLVENRVFLPGGRYLYATGREMHQTQNCLLLKAEDSREGWAELNYKATMALQTGAGIGIDYSDIRESGAEIKKTGGIASGPIPLMKMVNEIGRGVMQGGARRSAIWAGLQWDHPDCLEFIHIKDWSDEVKALKEKDFNFPAAMEFTNVSILLNDEFFEAYENGDHEKHELANKIYKRGVQQMVKSAEPGFSVDIGANAGETLRNACTEVTSRDDSDVCNLGSINLSRVRSKADMEKAVRLGTLFLMAGTVYSHLPYDKVADVRRQNRRLGLGLMGIHEWLLQRGKKYGPDDELAELLDIYSTSGDISKEIADKHGLSIPVKTRAIAPTGTIGIVAETTTGIEPIFCVAYKRRVKTAQALGNDITKFEYVVDPTAKRLIDAGADPDSIEDAYLLSLQYEKRIKFQAWVQKWVDHGISSTINLPYPIVELDEVDEFAEVLYENLPNIRGITVYPDGSRSGQPLTAVPLKTALDQEGVVFEEDEANACASGACGS
jgi:ribonucleoside-diphosphate reductase alpha chain